MDDLGRLLQWVDQIGVGLHHWEAVRLHRYYGLKRVVPVPHRIHRGEGVMSCRVDRLLRVPPTRDEVTTRLLVRRAQAQLLPRVLHLLAGRLWRVGASARLVLPHHLALYLFLLGALHEIMRRGLIIALSAHFALLRVDAVEYLLELGDLLRVYSVRLFKEAFAAASLLAFASRWRSAVRARVDAFGCKLLFEETARDRVNRDGVPVVLLHLALPAMRQSGRGKALVAAMPCARVV